MGEHSDEIILVPPNLFALGGHPQLRATLALEHVQRNAAQQPSDAGAVQEAEHGGIVDRRLRAGVSGVGWRDDRAE